MDDGHIAERPIKKCITTLPLGLIYNETTQDWTSYEEAKPDR